MTDSAVETLIAPDEVLVARLENLPGHRWSSDECNSIKEWLFQCHKEALIRRAQKRLSYSNERPEAEDAWSEFTARELDNVLARYDPLRSNLVQWVASKFRFFCSDLNRHRTTRLAERTQALDDIFIEVQPTHDPRRVYEARDLLTAAMRQLTPAERHLFTLRYLEQESYLVIAHAFEIPLGTVRSRLAALRMKLRKSITDLSKPRDTDAS